MTANERIFVGIGANLGAAAETVALAVSELATIEATQVVAVSSLYRSAPVDAAGPDYINAVAELRSSLEPLRLLAALHSIEQHHGRERPRAGAPRTLDLDLLLYGQRQVDSATLTLPHPRWRQRAFVLAPLAELAPGWRCDDGQSIEQALASASDQRVERIAPLTLGR
ncbi:MAG: 2-amino-4-hydroxy-6-hydroxymethyldihydropteridine diphosphokinase [Burkholderiaceae bacterium]